MLCFCWFTTKTFLEKTRDCHGSDRMVVGFTTICEIAVPITTEVVILNSAHGEVYSIQHYVIKFVSDYSMAGRLFSPGTPDFSNNKTDHHNINEILLKVALNTITLTSLKKAQILLFDWHW